MEDDDAKCFRESMDTEIISFNEEKLFKLTLLRDKSSYESLTPFIWFFERKCNLIGDLMKHEAALCAHGSK